MVGGEVIIVGVCTHHHIGLVWKSGGDAVIPNQGSRIICRWWRRTLLVAAHYVGYGGIVKKGEVSANC